MENLLANELALRLEQVPLPGKATARTIRRRSREESLITADEEAELERLESLRNPLTHYREANNPEHIDQQAMQAAAHTDEILGRDAVFAVALALRILAKPAFRL